MIVYCVLGLSATAVAFVLDLLGHPDARVYEGRSVEWGIRVDLPWVRAGRD